MKTPEDTPVPEPAEDITTDSEALAEAHSTQTLSEKLGALVTDDTEESDEKTIILRPLRPLRTLRPL